MSVLQGVSTNSLTGGEVLLTNKAGLQSFLKLVPIMETVPAPTVSSEQPLSGWLKWGQDFISHSRMLRRKDTKEKRFSSAKATMLITLGSFALFTDQGCFVCTMASVPLPAPRTRTKAKESRNPVFRRL